MSLFNHGRNIWSKVMTEEERKAFEAASGEVTITLQMSKERIVIRFKDDEFPIDLASPFVKMALMRGDISFMIGQRAIGEVTRARLEAAGLDIKALIAREKSGVKPDKSGEIFKQIMDGGDAAGQ